MRFISPLADCTAVPTSFITGPMCDAPGEYVKVYLYALQSASPNKEVSIQELKIKLHLSDAQIHDAFSYWRAAGLIKGEGEELSLIPPAGEHPPADVYNAELKGFYDRMSALFSRSLTLSELKTLNGFEERYGLSRAAVELLAAYCVKAKGKTVGVSYINKIAQDWGQKGVVTAEDAKAQLQKREARFSGAKKILSLMGRYDTVPGETEKAYYERWIYEWGFTHGAVEYAMRGVEFTSSRPFAYLNAILEAYKNADALTPERIDRIKEKDARLKEVLSALKYAKKSPNEKIREYYKSWRELGFAHDVILIACEQAADGFRKTDTVSKILQNWKDRGLSDAESVLKHLASQEETDKKIAQLYFAAGIERRIGESDRASYAHYTQEAGFPHELLMYAADISSLSEKPMPYMSAVLKRWEQDGVKTLEDAIAANNTVAAPKKGRADHNINERPYSREEFEEQKARDLQKLRELFGDD